MNYHHNEALERSLFCVKREGALTDIWPEYPSTKSLYASQV